jgi:MFS family permease
VSGSDPVAGLPAAGTRLVVPVLAVGSLAFSMLQSLVAPALTTIGAALGSSTADASWVLTAYLLAASVFTPVLGRLADMVGKRRVIIAVLATLLVGTVVSALAPNLGVLVLGRAIQGAAGAILPLSISMVRDVMPTERVASSVGLLSAIFGVGGGLGILVAGPILQGLGWHWLFWIPAALVAAALTGAVAGLPDSSIRRPGRLDIAGSLVLAVALVSILLGVTDGHAWGWLSLRILGLFALGVVALVGFVLLELRVADPLIDLRSFRMRGAWTAHVGALIVGFGMFALFVLVPTILQIPTSSGFGFGSNATGAGFALIPAVITMVGFSAAAGLLIRRLGPRATMVIGAAALAAAFVVAAIGHTQLWVIVTSVALAGAGIGIALSSIANALVREVAADHTGEALSTNAIARTIGSSVGTAVVASLLAGHITASGLPSEGGFVLGFVICGVVSALGIVAAACIPRAHATLVNAS